MTNLKNVLRGYNILAASNNLRIINDIKRDLTTSVISEMDGKASKLIFGQGVKETERAWQSLGSIKYGPTKAEEKSLVFRRSIYISKDVKGGEILTRDNVRIVRPGLGLPPKSFDLVIGKKVKMDLQIGTPLSWDHLF
jgi:sialic acid synthase SpsE